MFKLNHRPWITTNCHLRLTSQLIKFEKSLTSPEVDLYSWQQRKPTPQSYRQVNTLPKICYVPVIVTPRDSAIQTNNILLNMSILTWLSQEIIQVNVSSMIITRLVCRMKNMECNRVYVLLYRPNIIRFQYVRLEILPNTTLEYGKWMLDWRFDAFFYLRNKMDKWLINQGKMNFEWKILRFIYRL